ncbi:MAG TPA: hypothetical protein VIJ51_00605 [Solirubrobacteraceae bacterium]
MTVRRRLASGPLAVLACVALVSGTAGAAPAGTAPSASFAAGAVACKPPHYPSLGYFTSIKVTGTTCTTGTRLVQAFFRCRTKSGLAGRCRKTVLGFRCTEVRNAIATEIDALDTCRHGAETVVSGWQQDIG